MVRSEARVIGVFTLNAYEAFERERLRLLAETNKFLENVMFGYTPQEWLKAVEKADKQEQKLMTREEAFKRLPECYGDSFITALEALGLLKFDEVKKEGPIKRGDFIRVQWYDGSYTQGVVHHLERS